MLISISRKGVRGDCIKASCGAAKAREHHLGAKAAKILPAMAETFTSKKLMKCLLVNERSASNYKPKITFAAAVNRVRSTTEDRVFAEANLQQPTGATSEVDQAIIVRSPVALFAIPETLQQKPPDVSYIENERARRADIGDPNPRVQLGSQRCRAGQQRLLGDHLDPRRFAMYGADP
jgi:hypothetical protein